VKSNDLIFRPQPDVARADIDDEDKVYGAQLLCKYVPSMPSSFTSRNVYIQDLAQELELSPVGHLGLSTIGIEDEEILQLIEFCQSNPNVVIYIDTPHCNTNNGMDLVSFLQAASYAIEGAAQRYPKGACTFHCRMCPPQHSFRTPQRRL
jgi:hypothetical protein